MTWINKIKKGIKTLTSEKKETPEGIWVGCPSCKTPYTTEENKENFYVCKECDFHFRIGSAEYFDILFDQGKYERLFNNLESVDFLGFKDIKQYEDRIKDAQEKTNQNDAIASAFGKVGKHDIVVTCMDFNFIGGSMGSVVGETIARSIDHAIKEKCAFMMISKSGGARMMESAFSLMQMAKTSAKLNQLAQSKLPYISLLTDPTTGGVTASFAMLGDINIAEPKALIGFAGPRVIKETIKKELPEGFQTSEFLLEHGFLDFIVPRENLKEKVGEMIGYFKN